MDFTNANRTPAGQAFHDAGIESHITLNLCRAQAQVLAINLLGEHEAVFDIRPSILSHGGQEVSALTKPRDAEWTARIGLRLHAYLPGPKSTDEEREQSQQQLARIVEALQELIDGAEVPALQAEGVA